MLAALLAGAALAAPLPRADVEGIGAVREWALERVVQAEDEFVADGLSRAASPLRWDGEIVYGIMIDRFNDADAATNPPPLQINQLGSIPRVRHGGDLRGVEQRLDYLHDLGVTTLYLTPVFKHNGAYHGYCVTDLTEIDPGFGTAAEFRELVSEAHGRGMRVIMDIVVNHLCGPGTFYRKTPEHERCARELNDEHWRGVPAGSTAQGELQFSDNFFGPLRAPQFFNRCGPNDWHQTASQDATALFGDFVPEMFDFNTRDADFQNVFALLSAYWIAFADVDGFRMDAAKHVSEDFVATFSTQIRDYAKRLGKHNFFLVAEVMGDAEWTARRLGAMETNPSNPAEHGAVPRSATEAIGQLSDVYLSHGAANYPGANGVFDFALSSGARDYLSEARGPRALLDYTMSADYALLAQQNNPQLNWTVLETHDWPRFAARAHHNLWKSKVALAFLATGPGIPLIYYGMEQGFNGDCHWDSMAVGAATAAMRQLCATQDDSLYRQDMFVHGPWRLGSTVPSVDRLAGIGPTQQAVPTPWYADPMLQRHHDVYQTARRFNWLRRSCDVLRFGQTRVRHADLDGNVGRLVMSRLYQGDEAVVVVSNASYGLPLPDVLVEAALHPPGTVFRNALDPQQAGVVQLEGGQEFLRFGGRFVDGNSVAVFVPENKLGPYNRELGVTLCNDTPLFDLGPR